MTVTAQDPKPGTVVFEETRVRINVSRGEKPVGVPSVVGQVFESAASALQGAGFIVARQDVESSEAKGIVVAQDPPANTFQSKGSTVTLSVSKGPRESAVPSVESLDRQTAIDTLRASGFRVKVAEAESPDPASDGLVLAQDPAGGTLAKPNSVVTIFVAVSEGAPQPNGGDEPPGTETP